MKHEVIWTDPPPTWQYPSSKYAREPGELSASPSILRFAKDNFMEEFLNLLATEPQRITAFKARPETWRGFSPDPQVKKPETPSAFLEHLRLFRKPTPASTESAPASPAADTAAPFKLFQPAHQRHYLVTSSLVCKTPGLPDRKVETARNERVGFVLRRLLPETSRDDAGQTVTAWREHAWIPGETSNTWKRVPASSLQTLLTDEDLLPMFGVNLKEDDRPRRKLFAGVIPVGKREAYLGAPKTTDQPNPGTSSRTARKILLRSDFIEPWKALVSQSLQAARSLDESPSSGDDAPSSAEREKLIRLDREKMQTVSWLLLLDLARYLEKYLKPLWRAINDDSQISQLSSAHRKIYDTFADTQLENAFRTELQYRASPYVPENQIYTTAEIPTSLLHALRKYSNSDGSLNATLAQQLESESQPYSRDSASLRGLWPSFIFPLADLVYTNQSDLPPVISPVPSEDSAFSNQGSEPANAIHDRIDKLATLIARGLEDPDLDDESEPAIPSAAVAPADALEGWFLIRCVYDQPACQPLHAAVVSEPTKPFLLAGFFDPDAPARPIRIGLPIDTSPAGLRKFDKNTAFVISSTLCGQIKRAKSMTFGDLVLSVLPWPFHKDLPSADGGPCKTGSGPDLGMICSLSIPIITICALILLMIIVNLLDIIFRWIPYFIMCFPVPGLSGKKPPAQASTP